jgi:hypothetical protein
MLSSGDEMNSTDTAGETTPAPKRKGKKGIVVGIVVAVIVVVGIGFWAWHNTPGFCNAFCHSPMDPYLQTYEAQSGTPATDKYDHDVSNGSAMLAVIHREANVGCLGCHVPTTSQQIAEVQEAITGDYYDPIPEKTIKTLMENSDQASTDEATFCLKSGCHADESGTEITSHEQLEHATENLAFNPHDAHHGAIDCSNCHKSHRASVMYCTQCHSEAAASMPDGWVDYATGQKLGQAA